MNTTLNVLDSVIHLFRYYKTLADRAMDGLTDLQVHETPFENGNNIAIIVKHMAGNMRSRFTDFLHSDGEKSWRDRDGEFEDTYTGKDGLLEDWESGWGVLFNTLEALQPSDLTTTVTIRKEPHTVLEAIARQLAHYASHVGQIVYLAKGIQGERWVPLTIPKGQSSGWNEPFLK